MSIEVQSLTKYLGSRKVLDDVSFNIQKGEIVGFLGPNGAGKTTTMRILTGFLSYTDGSVKINQKEIADHPIETKRHIGYVPEQPPLYRDLTVIRYLEFMCQLKEISHKNQSEELARVLQLAHLEEVAHRIIGHLSKGFRQRVCIAQSLIGNPEILIFDEPTEGLDPGQIREVRELIQQLADHHTVILSTHILPEAQATCDRVLIIHQGKIVASDSIDAIARHQTKGDKVFIEIEGPSEQIHQTLQAHPSIQAVLIPSQRAAFNVFSQKEFDLRPYLFNLCAQNNWIIYEMKTIQHNLEDIFLELTT